MKVKNGKDMREKEGKSRNYLSGRDCKGETEREKNNENTK